MPFSIIKRPFYWFTAPRYPRAILQVEGTLGVARIILVACILIGTLDARPHPSWNILLPFAVSSLLILPALRLFPRPAFQWFVLLYDIHWAVLFTLLQDSNPGIPVLLCLFALMGAALRWGFWETIASAAVLYPVLLFGSRNQAWAFFDTGAGDTFAGLLLPAFLSIFGVALIAFLAEAKEHRAKAEVDGGISEYIRSEAEVGKIVGFACTRILQLFRAGGILVATRETKRGQAFLWTKSGDMKTFETARLVELDQAAANTYFFPVPENQWGLSGHKNRIRAHTESGRWRGTQKPFSLPESFPEKHPFRCIMEVSGNMTGNWEYRVFLIDPLCESSRTNGLRYLSEISGQIASLVHSLFLAQWQTTNTEAETCSRVACELHDGVIQSLSGIDLQLETLRITGSGLDQNDRKSLDRIQESIRDEIQTVREMAHRLRATDIDPLKLLDYLSGLARKHETEFGIPVQFTSEKRLVPLPRRSCLELVRIVQEALINIRKHASADEISIHFGNMNGSGTLEIADNGSGFGFTGLLTGEQLEAAGHGPQTIMERVRALDGTIAIESDPGRGSLLTITFPVESYD